MASIESVHKTITQIQDQGYSVLRSHFPSRLVDACREAFWPRLLAHLDSGQAPNRGPHRHFLPMPFEPPCFTPRFFFDPDVLGIVRGLTDDRVVADQWGCDVPLRGSEYQRGTPNTSNTPRAFCTIRYVRHWYADASRDVQHVPPAMWESLTAEQQRVMRFPIGE